MSNPLLYCWRAWWHSTCHLLLVAYVDKMSALAAFKSNHISVAPARPCSLNLGSRLTQLCVPPIKLAWLALPPWPIWPQTASAQLMGLLARPFQLLAQPGQLFPSACLRIWAVRTNPPHALPTWPLLPLSNH